MKHPSVRPALLALAALLAGARAAAQDPALHGAAPAGEQLAALDRLGLAKEAITPPAGVDARVWTASIVPGNEPNAERVALGRKLYFDTVLSKDGTVSCATCHDATRSFTDRRPVSEGIGGRLGRRNAPTTLNAALLSEQFWDGRATTVEHQAGMPILNEVEMGEQSEDEVVARVTAAPGYLELFQRAYGRVPTYDDIGSALGAFERTLIFLDAPFDRAMTGKGELTESERRGLVLFEGKARCSGCHPLNPASPLGTDNQYHNIGVSARTKDFESLARQALAALRQDSSEEALDELALATDLGELGRFIITKNRADIGAFKTEQLRNVGITAPYMHDGSLQTLWDVMDHYNKGGEDNPFLDGGIEALALTDAEIDDVVAFLFTLTDVRFDALNRSELEEQRAKAARSRPFKDEALALRREIGFERRVLGKQ